MAHDQQGPSGISVSAFHFRANKKALAGCQSKERDAGSGLLYEPYELVHVELVLYAWAPVASAE